MCLHDVCRHDVCPIGAMTAIRLKNKMKIRKKMKKMMKMQKMKHCLASTFCGFANCCFYCCCPGKCEVGQRYRGEQGEIKYNCRGDPIIG